MMFPCQTKHAEVLVYLQNKINVTPGADQQLFQNLICLLKKGTAYITCQDYYDIKQSGTLFRYRCISQ